MAVAMLHIGSFSSCLPGRDWLSTTALLRLIITSIIKLFNGEQEEK